MSTNKTLQNAQPVEQYIASIEDDARRNDAQQLISIMQSITGEKPSMWGKSIVGFGSYHYKYASGREGDSLRVGFAARKANLVIYGLTFYDTLHENTMLLEKLGSYKSGKGCLYVHSLSDVDVAVLKKMIRNAYSSK